MQRKELGKSGVHLPEIGLGTWNYHGGVEPLRTGLEMGALFIDTAESYGTETVVAEAVRGMRDRVFLATKVSPDHFRHDDVLKAADNSLRRLRTDHIDLYQLHEPNHRIPVEETLGAMEELVDAGKVRFIGVSNFTVTELQRAQRAMRKHTIVSNQVRYNLVDRTIEKDLLRYCEANGIVVIAHTPLARGLPHILDRDPGGALVEIAGTLGKTPAQVALNWCLRHRAVVVIPKGNSAEHVAENCGASDWRLDPEHVRRLDQEIRFRRRGRLEIFLRRRLPPGVKNGIRSLVQRLPRG
ncbi:MAG: aldo/keto reductase [Verrucomicrobiia bacterium]|jgi:diketogulonate reductase-like aldo/keto reductase